MVLYAVSARTVHSRRDWLAVSSRHRPVRCSSIAIGSLHNTCQSLACGMQQALPSLAVGKREPIPFPLSLARGGVSVRCDSARENRCSYKPESRQPNNRCVHLVCTNTVNQTKWRCTQQACPSSARLIGASQVHLGTKPIRPIVYAFFSEELSAELDLVKETKLIVIVMHWCVYITKKIMCWLKTYLLLHQWFIVCMLALSHMLCLSNHDS